MPDVYKDSNKSQVAAQPCYHNWLIWERVWDSRTIGTGKPLIEIGRYRRCVRRLQSSLPPWAYDEMEKHRHKLDKCATCQLYKHDSPDTRDRHWGSEYGPKDRDLIPRVNYHPKPYDPNKTTEAKIEGIPF